MTQTISRELANILLDTIEAYNAGDPERIPLDMFSGWINMGSEPDRGIDRAFLTEAFATGLRTQLHWARLHVQIYGDAQNFALASGTLDGWIRFLGGQRLEGPWAFHKRWVKEGEEWKTSSCKELSDPNGMKELEPSLSG